MAEHVIPAIVGAAIGGVASFVGNKSDELSGVSDKVNRLECKLLKIDSAIEESEKYDIDNEPLREWQQKFIDVAKEAKEVLQDFKNRSTASNPQSTGQGVTAAGLAAPLIVRRSIEWKRIALAVALRFKNWKYNLIRRISEMEKLNRTLEKLEMTSNDVGDFLKMVRQQKRKRDRRRRYRPYKHFFEFTYLDLLQDALGYCRVHFWWMRFLLPETGTVVEPNRVSGLKVGAASVSPVPKMLVDVVSFSRKSLLLV